jgi:hypothetical protein
VVCSAGLPIPFRAARVTLLSARLSVLMSSPMQAPMDWVFRTVGFARIGEALADVPREAMAGVLTQAQTGALDDALAGTLTDAQAGLLTAVAGTAMVSATDAAAVTDRSMRYRRVTLTETLPEICAAILSETLIDSFRRSEARPRVPAAAAMKAGSRTEVRLP